MTKTQTKETNKTQFKDEYIFSSKEKAKNTIEYEQMLMKYIEMEMTGVINNG